MKECADIFVKLSNEICMMVQSDRSWHLIWSVASASPPLPPTHVKGEKCFALQHTPCRRGPGMWRWLWGAAGYLQEAHRVWKRWECQSRHAEFSWNGKDKTCINPWRKEIKVSLYSNLLCIAGINWKCGVTLCPVPKVNTAKCLKG